MMVVVVAGLLRLAAVHPARDDMDDALDATTAAFVRTDTAAGGAKTDAKSPQDTSATMAVTCDTSPEYVA